MTTSSSVGQKLWNYCNVLRDAGLSYGDYLEQLTYLIFLKMMDERSRPPYTLQPDYRPPSIPQGCDWPSLLARDGEALEAHYRHTLEILGRQTDTLGVIFRKAQNRIQDPAMLSRLIRELINSENWSALSADVKGDAYESLLERNAQDVKTGAGQYFTPRPLIQAIVEVMRPQPDTTICDPACGTGGFLLAAHDYIVAHNRHMDQGQREHLRNSALHGWEIVDGAARLGVMNLYLHSIGGDKSTIKVDDSLRNQPDDHFDMVLTNPPFGRKSSLTFVNTEGETERESAIVERPDFWASTSNKQLNFLQHVRSLLKMHGKAAIVVPDNVLFEGGAGETVRRQLLQQCDVHTLAATAHRCVLRPGRQGQRDLLRQGSPPARHPGPAPCGFTTCAPTSDSPSRRIPCAAPTWTTLWSDTILRTAWSVRRLSDSTASPTMTFWLVTRPIWTSSGCGTRAWRTRPTCLRLTRLREEIVEDLRSALEQMEEIAGDLAPGLNPRRHVMQPDLALLLDPSLEFAANRTSTDVSTTDP